ncbi:hypothetical protein EI613_20130 [Azospirillum sp. 412522]|nr:hypothetical protein [Azospirillum sp. 412522]MBY6264209.1 hypothetical protein [Azospirillum sp. 412522]
MIKRLPRYAEIELQRLCAKAGALCHAVDEDESGWDRLIEFPEKVFLGPADMRPPRAVAYAQVKSVENGAPVCRVKLSNALRAAQSPQPWFIVLVTGETHNQPSKVFAVHVWDDLICRTLEAVRRAHNDRRSLHKCSLTIRFRSEDEVGERLVQWMQEAIDAVQPAYESSKRFINTTAGYEDGYGTGLLTVEGEDEEEILNNFLGLGTGLRVNNFTFTPSRFGIPLSSPEIDISEGVVYIEPHPKGDIEIRLRSTASARTIVQQGHAYGIGLPGIPDHQKRIRFSAGFVEVLCALDGHAEFTAHLNSREKHKLTTLEDYAALNEWLKAGPVNLQVWTNGKRVIASTLNNRTDNTGIDWPNFSSALRLLRLIAGNQDPEISLHDLCLASGLGTFSNVADSRSLRLEFDPLAFMPTRPATAILFWLCFDIGEYSFYAMADWPVIEDVMINNKKRRVTASKGQIVESYVLRNPSEEERGMMERDYRYYCDNIAKGGVPLEMGNLYEFILSCQRNNITENE